MHFPPNSMVEFEATGWQNRKREILLEGESGQPGKLALGTAPSPTRPSTGSHGTDATRAVGLTWGPYLFQPSQPSGSRLSPRAPPLSSKLRTLMPLMTCQQWQALGSGSMSAPASWTASLGLGSLGSFHCPEPSELPAENTSQGYRGTPQRYACIPHLCIAQHILQNLSGSIVVEFLQNPVKSVLLLVRFYREGY